MFSNNIHHTVNNMLNSLKKYDFKNHTIDTLKDFMEDLFNEEIHIIPGDFPYNFFAAWVQDADVAQLNYIFVNQKQSEDIQDHAVVHEFGHKLAGHKTWHLTDEEVINAILYKKIPATFFACRALNQKGSMEEEIAETFANVFRDQLVNSGWLKSSSNQGRGILNGIFRS
jgi:hypothetical protein